MYDLHGSTPPATEEMPALPYASAVGEAPPAEGSYPLGGQARNPRARLDQLGPSFCLAELRRAGAGGKADDGCEHAFWRPMRQERGCAEVMR